MTTVTRDEAADRPTVPGAGEQLMLIDGERMPALAGDTIDVFDPSTGELIGTTPDGQAADVDRAVAVAERTFDERVWQGLSGAARQKILWRAADLIEQHTEELAALESLNNGMVIPMAQALIATAAETIRYYAGWATKLYGITSEISSLEAQYHTYTLREPVGVCALIIPWNAPSTLTVQKLAPALAAGCSVVIKPSEETPFTALRLAEPPNSSAADPISNVLRLCPRCSGTEPLPSSSQIGPNGSHNPPVSSAVEQRSGAVHHIAGEPQSRHRGRPAVHRMPGREQRSGRCPRVFQCSAPGRAPSTTWP
ncbi:aldehyde dehydrogenase family protein, partial [Streptomyces sp. NPDC002920]